MQKFIYSLLMLSCLGLLADEVKMKNGSFLIGEISKVHKDEIYILTEFAGEISIDLEHVVYYKTDKEVSYRTEDKEEHKSLYDSRKEPEAKVLWTEKDPDLKEYLWEKVIWTDFVRRTGNSTSSNFAAGFRLELDREFDTTKFYGRYIRNKRKEVSTSDERSIGLDFETRFGEDKRHSWYFRADFENDKVEDLSLRSTIGSGYGYYIIKDDFTSLRGRLGLLHRQENYYEDESQSSLAMDFGALYEQTLFEDLNWYTEVTYSPAFDAGGNYRIVHESGLEMPLALKIDLTLRSGVEHSYNSIPSDDREPLDTRYFMRLELNF